MGAVGGHDRPVRCFSRAHSPRGRADDLDRWLVQKQTSLLVANEETNIPFIHNYCDRWCERSEFSARCTVFADEAQAQADLANSEDPIGDAVRTVAMAFADAKRMLMEKAEEMGIDLEAAMNDPEIEAGIERRREAVESEDAVELARNYGLETMSVLETSPEWLADTDDPMTGEMLEILRWYLFLIGAKVHRGYHGILDLDGFEDRDELLDTQSDANGSIKIALISIERSILAWTYLCDENNKSVIRPVIEKLEIVKQKVEQKFPNARDFVRPGFDEIEMVM